MGHRFIAGGDFNAKHPQWGSRLVTPRGRELYKAKTSMNLEVVSTGQPTYWPTDRNKTPDVIDICVTKGLSSKYLKAESCLDLSSDHSPIIISVSNQIHKKDYPPTLSNKKTDWECFRAILEESINTKIPLKIETDVEAAVEHFNHCIQQAAWNSTPMNPKNGKISCSIAVRDKIADKRKLRKQWQKSIP